MRRILILLALSMFATVALSAQPSGLLSIQKTTLLVGETIEATGSCDGGTPSIVATDDSRVRVDIGSTTNQQTTVTSGSATDSITTSVGYSRPMLKVGVTGTSKGTTELALLCDGKPAQSMQLNVLAPPTGKLTPLTLTLEVGGSAKITYLCNDGAAPSLGIGARVFKSRPVNGVLEVTGNSVGIDEVLLTCDHTPASRTMITVKPNAQMRYDSAKSDLLAAQAELKDASAALQKARAKLASANSTFTAATLKCKSTHGCVVK